MSSSSFFSSSQRLPSTSFDGAHRLLAQMADELTPAGVVVTESDLIDRSIRTVLGVERFVGLVSPRFSALFLAQKEASETITPASASPRLWYEVSLIFDPEAIAQFLSRLAPLLYDSRSSTLRAISAELQPNDPQLQSAFTLQLIQALSQSALAHSTNHSSVENLYPLVCQPVELALRQQLEQERLLNQVITQLRQSLELPVILETAVQQVRQFLQVDRLVIYQFDQRLGALSSNPSKERASGNTCQFAFFSDGTGDRSCITYEARASDTIPSTLGLTDSHCFANLPDYLEKYAQGVGLAIPDVETLYCHAPCLLEALRNLWVRSKLVVPILVREQVWGLLIAHQCTQPRFWHEREQTFLQQIAEHLAIAISQAQLYTELHLQKQTLEQRVLARTEDLRDAMLAAQAADRTKTEFLAVMSHELRTPLTSIIGMSTTLIRWVGELLTPRQLGYLHTIHDSGKHLLELINDILDLSQVEAGKVVLDLSEISITSLCQQMLKMLQEQAHLQGVELNFVSQLDGNSDRCVVDPRRVRQILLNLLSNAIKFTPAGGQVTLQVFADQAYTTLQIQDTGIGISAEQRPLLFQKFQQLDTSYSRQYGGTGLGLALTKQLVELHGGYIDVESTLGSGSTFTVCLPIRQPLLPKTNTFSSNLNSDAVLPSGRIVLIEHHEDTANLICDLLNAAGYQLIWMVEGATALDQIELLQPNAVIVNLQVPDTDGYMLIRHLRQNPVTRQLKIVALVESPSSQMPETCLLAGADDYLAYPLEPDQLIDKITTLVIKPL